MLPGHKCLRLTYVQNCIYLQVEFYICLWEFIVSGKSKMIIFPKIFTYNYQLKEPFQFSSSTVFFYPGPSMQDNYYLGYWDVLDHVKIILQRYTLQTIEQHKQDSCHKHRLTGHSLAFSHNIENQSELAGVKFLDSHLTE
jgi:hypothetical protein